MSDADNLGLSGDLGLFVAEILPFHLRMHGQECFQLFATSFTLLTTYVFPVGLQNMQWKFYLIWLPLVLTEALVVWLIFLETKGQSLGEIAEIFHGPGGAWSVNMLSILAMPCLMNLKGYFLRLGS